MIRANVRKDVLEAVKDKPWLSCAGKDGGRIMKGLLCGGCHSGRPGARSSLRSYNDARRAPSCL